MKIHYIVLLRIMVFILFPFHVCIESKVSFTNFRLKTEILIDMLAQKSAEVDALLRDNENLRAFIQDNIKQPGSRENEI